MKTTENNKLIAKFMGDITSLSDKVSFNKNCSINDLQYHTSWDWLMPVVNKVKRIEKFELEEIGVFETTEEVQPEISHYEYSIEETYRAVVEFIKRYNENTEEKKFTVWVGGLEVNDYLLTKKQAEDLKKKYISEGYEDVVIGEEE